MSKDYPVFFNDEMVRAILDGRKTQTRRVIKLSHERGMLNPVVRGRNGEISSVSCRLAPTLCPFGQSGDAKKRLTFSIQHINRHTMIQGAGLRVPDWLKKMRRRQKARSGKTRWNCPCCGKTSWQFNPYDFEGCRNFSCEGWRP
ncbi:hypothetical protein K9O81_18920 [Leclercia adecarboxylata]|nr:hypothetical protein [Leclercia adecarboxylata]MBZ3807080.1 hypothetical protein [Leclercia adecarboxylata]